MAAHPKMLSFYWSIYVIFIILSFVVDYLCPIIVLLKKKKKKKKKQPRVHSVNKTAVKKKKKKKKIHRDFYRDI